eukprot:TRINITY_DN6510_c0_g1_i1.p1 TRINITY_DN6510_c0_g1~~TRINITY_DN6510_c0_g1_i1.p1  ORF type:complete len:103 (+),score=25.57 TRINITY_DN6510_c0_g1_i1:109-417(+)
MIRRPPRSTHCISSAASDVYKRQKHSYGARGQLTTGFSCLLYTSDAADDMQCVDLGGRRIIKKKKKKNNGDQREAEQTNKRPQKSDTGIAKCDGDHTGGKSK